MHRRVLRFAVFRAFAVMGASCLLACGMTPLVARAADDAIQPGTLRPESRSDKWWQDRYTAYNEAAKKGGYDLIFLGDSITEQWSSAGKDVWEKTYGPRHALNLGIGGDQTQHVLWRLENGNLEGLRPKLVVLMIGTNNSNGKDFSAEDIGAGIQAIVKKLRSKLPESKVLILGIFPRSEKPNPQREKNAKASEIAAQLADSKDVFYLDIGPKFLNADGAIAREIMPDLLHLSPQGYQIWADAIESKVAELLGEKK